MFALLSIHFCNVHVSWKPCRSSFEVSVAITAAAAIANRTLCQAKQKLSFAELTLYSWAEAARKVHSANSLLHDVTFSKIDITNLM